MPPTVSFLLTGSARSSRWGRSSATERTVIDHQVTTARLCDVVLVHLFVEDDGLARFFGHTLEIAALAWRGGYGH